MTRLSAVAAFLALFLVSGLSQGEIYKTVDENGKVVYSDTLPAGSKAETVDLPDINTTPKVKVRPRPKPAAPAAPPKYRLSIKHPAHDFTVPPGQLRFSVVTDLSPELQEGHTLQIFMDNSLLATSGNSATVVDMERGSHEIHAQVVDAEGKVLTKSKSHTVHVKRTSILNPNHPANRETIAIPQ